MLIALRAKRMSPALEVLAAQAPRLPGGLATRWERCGYTANCCQMDWGVRPSSLFSASFKSCSSRTPLLAFEEFAVIHPSVLGTRAKRCLWRSIEGCWWLEPVLRRRCQPETCLLTALLEPAAGRGRCARRRAGFDLAAGT